jgi:hypothetical protein
VVADLGGVLEDRGVQQVAGAREPQTVAAVAHAGAQVPVDGAGAVLLGHQGVDGAVGDLAQRLVPGHALPAALAALPHALQRVREPTAVVHAVAVAGSLLAAARVEVGHVGVGLLVAADLLLAPDDSVAHVHVPGAAAVVAAVDVVGALHDPVPPPLPAVQVGRLAVAHGAGDGSRSGGGEGGTRAPEVQEGQGEGAATRPKESPAREHRGHRIVPTAIPPAFQGVGDL